MKISYKAKFLSLALLLILPLAFSCGDSPEPAPGTNTEKIDVPDAESAQEENAPAQAEKPALDLPDVKYGGYDFRVINVDQSAMTWVYTTIVAHEDTGVEVNDAVYLRNRLVEDRFDINIVEVTENASSSVASKAARSIQAGSDDYDLIMAESFDAVGMSQKDLLCDYNKIPYVDLTQPWWDRDMVRDLSIGKRNYMVTGDFSMMHYGDTIGMFFNKKLLTDMGLDSPYGVINEGKWTYDKFFDMAKDASRDLDGDGKYTKDDQFGYMSLTHIWSPGFLAAAGLQSVGKDENDMHSFIMRNERFVQIYQKMIEIIHYENMTFDADTAGNHRLQDIMFPNNQALFWSEVVHWATILRNMHADFGIIIHPKWDENQTDYHNYVYPPPVMGVPATALDIERTGMIIEALCYESTDTVIKAYYDVLLKTKISRDDESEKMLDIMFQNRWYNLSNIFYGSEIYNPLNTLSKKSDADIASWFDKNESKILAAIEKNNQAFGGD